VIDSWQRGVQLRVFVNNVAVALRAVLKLKLRHGNGFFDLFLASADAESSAAPAAAASGSIRM
jgi:hypothetical protein